MAHCYLMIYRIIFICLLLTGCGPLGFSNEPDWAKGPAIAENTCPDVQGTFLMDEPVLAAALWQPSSSGHPVTLKSLAGGLQVSYEVFNGSTSQEPKTIPKINIECEQGWLRLPWPFHVFPMRDYAHLENSDLQMDLRIMLRKNRDGQLISRIDIVTWSGVSVWCGDGCKYIEIPGTRRTKSEYAKWGIWKAEPIGVKAPKNIQYSPAVDKLLKVLPKSIKVLSITEDGSTTRIAAKAPSTLNIVGLNATLMESDLSTSVTSTSNAAGELVLEFLVTPLKTFTTEEKEQRTKSSRERDARIKKAGDLFWPLLPKGAQMTNIQWGSSADSIDVEVRIPVGMYVNTVETQLRVANVYKEVRLVNYGAHPMGGTAAKFTVTLED